MNTLTLTNPAYFLGLELATDQLRAAVLDTNLTVLGYESVDFDTELHYGTRGGLFSTPGDAFTTPVDMWLKAMDLLFNKLGERFDLGKVKAIGGSAQSATVWLSPQAQPALALLSADQPLSSQIPPAFFSLLHTPVSQDTSTLPQTVAFQSAFGGPDAMTSRVGLCAHPSLPAVQCMKIRDGNKDTWFRTGRVLMASTFLASLMVGKVVSMTEGEAMEMGLWNVKEGGWDQLALELVGGNAEQGRRFKEMLGEVGRTSGKSVGNVSPYWVERYGFEKDCIVTPFTSDTLAQYLSVTPSKDDTVLSFGIQDTLMIPAAEYVPNKLYRIFPHPAQDPSEPKKYVAVITSRNADASRTLVRDMYTKTWTSFDRLISIIPPGGSIGLDDKLFSFFILHNESPTSHSIRKGIYRIETGAKVTEFRDLRANPRCLVESQVLAFRVGYARLMSLPLFAKGKSTNPTKRGLSLLAFRMGVSFDPYDQLLCPKRIIAIGNAANFPSIVALIGDVFNAPVFVPTGAPILPPNSPNPTQLEYATNMDTGSNGLGPNTPNPARANAAIGAAYVARWTWSWATKPDGNAKLGFEEQMTGLIKKRWISPSTYSSSHGLLGLGLGLGGMGMVQGYPQPKRSGLTSTDEVETETIVYQPPPPTAGLSTGGLTPPMIRSPGFPGVGLGLGMHHFNGSASSLHDANNVNPNLMAPPTMPMMGRARTPTTSSQTTNSTVLSSLTTSSLANSTSTAQTSPGGNTPTSTKAPANTVSNANAGAPGVSVHALPTADGDSQKGLCKVAEADWDAFMVYASIVPEWCRLEGMLVKGC